VGFFSCLNECLGKTPEASELHSSLDVIGMMEISCFGTQLTTYASRSQDVRKWTLPNSCTEPSNLCHASKKQSLGHGCLTESPDTERKTGQDKNLVNLRWKSDSIVLLSMASNHKSCVSGEHMDIYGHHWHCRLFVASIFCRPIAPCRSLPDSHWKLHLSHRNHWTSMLKSSGIEW